MSRPSKTATSNYKHEFDRNLSFQPFHSYGRLNTFQNYFTNRSIVVEKVIEVKESQATQPQDDPVEKDWLVGGPSGNKYTVLVFRTCALIKGGTLPETTQPLSENKTKISKDIGTSDEKEYNKEPNFKQKSQISGHNKSSPFHKLSVSSQLQPNDTFSSNESLSERSETESEIETRSSGVRDNVKNTENRLQTSLQMEDESEKLTEIVKMPPIEEMPGFKLHMQYKTVHTETKLLCRILKAHGLKEVVRDESDCFNLLWTGVHLKPDILRSLTPYQRVNHFPRSYEMTRKDRLYKNIEHMQYKRGTKQFDFIPRTYVLPGDYREMCSAQNRTRGPWIVKPAASSRGRGIYIVNSVDQVPLDEPVVVAKYIANPLLIEGHKCDLRLYVLVTSMDPLIIYLYEEGLVRLATVKYDKSPKNLWNPCMHLCNYSINKYHSDYIKSEDATDEDVGHKWTVSALLRQLKAQGRDTGLLMSQIEDLIVKSFLACGQSMISACKIFMPHPNNCFELFGFDILIDDFLKPWLLEVNLSPSLGVDSPLDIRIKSSLLVDTLTLVGLPAMDPFKKGIPEVIPKTESKSKLKMSSSCRRVHSAELISAQSKVKLPQLNSTPLLTPEEQRMVRNVNAQFNRRGGFVRVFPTADSMYKYAQYLDPITGAPTKDLSLETKLLTTYHNYNAILHSQLFPDVKNLTQRFSSERLLRYERMLNQGLLVSLDDENKRTNAKGVTPKVQTASQRAEHKVKLLQLMDNGCHLSQGEARRAFGQYLAFILKRISSPNVTKNNSKNDDGNTQGYTLNHGDVVLKFLQRASYNLKTPYFVKIPSHKLVGKDRNAVIAKQLNDFLYLYNRETELYSDCTADKPNHVPQTLFNSFLLTANESDIEDVLNLQTRLHQGANSFLGARSSTNIQNNSKTSDSETNNKQNDNSKDMTVSIPNQVMPTAVLGLLKSFPFFANSSNFRSDNFKLIASKSSHCINKYNKVVLRPAATVSNTNTGKKKVPVKSTRT